MGYPEHFLCSFGGALGTDKTEHWSCGIRMILEVIPGAVDSFSNDDWLENQGAHIVEWFQRPETHISQGTYLQFIKLNKIKSDGYYQDPEHPHTRLLPDIPASNSASHLPFQACVVVTTRTHAATAGPASRGRFYQPWPNVSVGDNGLFPIGDATAIAGSAHDLLDNMEVASLVDGWTFRPNIVSPLGDGHAHLIDYVTVDNRIDIQRRRANQLKPAKATSEDIVY